MAIIVAYKYAANPQNATVAADGRVDWSRTKEAVSEYDPVAITVGRQLADAQGCELVGLSVGTSAVASPLAKKAALARGLDRALLVADDSVPDWAPTRVGSALAALAGRVENATCLLTGDASVDESAQVMPAIVAGYLGWPCFLEVIAITANQSGWSIVQAYEGGTRTIEVAGPVVVSVTTYAAEPKVPGMKDILAAGKKQVEQVAISQLPIAAVPFTVLGHERPPVKTRESEIFSGDDAVQQLVCALRTAGVV